MNIEVEKWIINNDNSDDDCSYHIVNISKCCDKIINSKNIELNSEFDNDGLDSYTFKFVRTENIEYDVFESYYETIKFCPFCGKKININVINIVNKTKEYNYLMNQRKMFWDKLNNTDSKKETELLQIQVTKLDNDINKILSDDNLKILLKKGLI
ncbi:MAG: hypothetical protein LIR50_19375 [Bacillota bacterium]|nr:hypothetical protein [Bacillota bacterium]